MESGGYISSCAKNNPDWQYQFRDPVEDNHPLILVDIQDRAKAAAQRQVHIYVCVCVMRLAAVAET